MINYNKNKLINKTLDKFYETFSHTLDTADFVPEKYNKYICKYIFKNMKKAFRKIDKEDRKYQKQLKEKLKIAEKNAKNQEKMPKNTQKTEILEKNQAEGQILIADSNDNS